MRFRITYVSPRRPPKVVDEAHFARSAAFAPVLRLGVGRSITGRYHSAGYRKIERVA